MLHPINMQEIQSAHWYHLSSNQWWFLVIAFLLCSMSSIPTLNTNSKAFWQNTPLLVLLSFFIVTLPLYYCIALYPTHTQSWLLFLPASQGSVQRSEVVLDSQLQLREQTVGERERESMAFLQTQKHSTRILITANIWAVCCYLQLQHCLW